MWHFFLKINIVAFSCFFSSSISYCQSWSQKCNYGGGNTYQATGFPIGNKGYIGLGNSGSLKNDFWEYDPATNAWTQKANFGGTPRQTATGFSIGLKGYIGSGQDANGLLNDLWEYDPASNVWTQKSSLPGSARAGAVGFSIGNYGYIGTGSTGLTSATNDFWQYDPLNDSWAQKANAGGPIRYYAIGFSINNKGYIGTGWDQTGSSYTSDFWEYNPISNIWVQKANLPGPARMEAVGFSIPLKNKGYIATGYSFASYLNDFWEYDPLLNTWSPMPNFGGTARNFAVGFSTDSCAYLGTGWDPFKKKDFWEYGGCAVCIPPNASASANITICSGTSDTISAIASGGSPPYAYKWIPATGLACPTCSSTAASPTTTTTYSVIVTDIGNCPDTNEITVTVYQSPHINAGPDVTVNHVQNTTLVASGNGGYVWNTGSVSASIIVAPSTTTMYTVFTSDSNGCTSIASVTVFVKQSKGPVYLPNAFSPNQDGDNDVLQLYFDAWLVQDASIFIYDRWGELIFESTDKNFKWDGSYKGRILNTSVLVYHLSILFNEGPQLFQKGNISLVR